MLSSGMTKELKALPVIMTVKEIADYLSVCQGTVYQMIYNKELSAYKAAGEIEWNITREDLQIYCEKNLTR